MVGPEHQIVANAVQPETVNTVILAVRHVAPAYPFGELPTTTRSSTVLPVTAKHTSVVGAKRPYTAPTVTKLGTLHELTLQLQNKTLGPTDGFTFNDAPIQDASP
jgi:hypothetical protein